ncbi:rho gtpase-activating protein [Anaeramoeba flamelloides]|uniref:Rho gtpase-activating protein n=1 Tax=Anaeramoeba flamelloides TaxID=1746091 RepID=A0AAV7Z7P4_9EUKA|nr:rho gtpase-activating protein [Anaeramoeba flamelloides]
MSVRAKKKKLNVFCDDKKTPLKRIKHLHEYLGLSSEEDQITAYIENYNEVYNLLLDTFHGITGKGRKKIPVPGNKGNKEKTPDTKEERIGLFKNLLGFITKQTNHKEFWIQTFNKCFITTLYPKIASNIGLLQGDTNTGFLNHCPYELQVLIVDHFLIWIKEGKLNECLFDITNNRTIILEIFRQGLLLPIGYDNTVFEILDQYEKWLKNKKKRPKAIRENLQFFLQTFISHILEAFFVTYDPQDLEQVVERCNRYLFLLETFGREIDDYLTQETWFHLLEGMLRTTNKIFGEALPGQKRTLAASIGGNLIGTLITIWLCSRTSSRYHWNLFEQCFLRCRDYFPVVIQWKRTLIKLTSMFYHYILGLDTKFLTIKEETDFSKRRKRNIELENPDEFLNQLPYGIESKFELIPPNSNEEEAIAYYIKFDNLRWNRNLGLFYWSKFLNLLGKVNSINDEKTHSIVISTYVEVYDLIYKIFKKFPIFQQNLIKKQEKLTEKEIMNNNMIKQYEDMESLLSLLYQQCIEPPYWYLFLPHFLEATFGRANNFENPHKIGQQIAIGAICMIVCRKHENSISEAVLPRIYYSLVYCLGLKDRNILLNILEYGSNFFTYCIPGSNGMINSFLTAIEWLLDPKNGFDINEPSFIKSLNLLSSLIAYQDQFENVEIYDYCHLLNVDPLNPQNFVLVQKWIEEEILQREKFALELVELKRNGDNKTELINSSQIEMQRQRQSQETFINQNLQNNKNNNENGNENSNNNDNSNNNNNPNNNDKTYDNDDNNLLKKFLFDQLKIRERIINLLINLKEKKKDNLSIPVRLSIIWILYSCIILELNKINKDDNNSMNENNNSNNENNKNKKNNKKIKASIKLVEKSINCIVQFTTDRISILSENANQVIRLLCNYDLLIEKYLPNFVKEILMNFVQKIQKNLIDSGYIQENFNKKGEELNSNIPITNWNRYLFQTIQDWIITKPHLLYEQKFSESIFNLVFNCLGLNNLSKPWSRAWEHSNDLLDSINNINKINNGFDKIQDLLFTQSLKDRKETIKYLSKEDISICLHDLILQTKKRELKIKESNNNSNTINKSNNNNNPNNPNNNKNNNNNPNNNSNISSNNINSSSNNSLDQDEESPLIHHLSHDLINIAEIFLLHLLNYWNNYPLCEIPELSCSSFVDDKIDIPEGYVIQSKKDFITEKIIHKEQNKVPEEDKVEVREGGKIEESEEDLIVNKDFPMSFDDYSQIFALKDGAIVTLFQIPIKNIKTNKIKLIVRIIIRDITGKYVWDLEKLEDPNDLLNNEKFNKSKFNEINLENVWNYFSNDLNHKNKKEQEREQEKGQGQEQEQEQEQVKESEKDQNKERVQQKKRRRRGTLPSSIIYQKENLHYKEINMLSELNRYISESSNDENERKYDLQKPSINHYSKSKNLKELHDVYIIQETTLNQRIEKIQTENLEKENNILQQPKKKQPRNHWSLCRLLIANLGFLSIDDRDDLVPLKRSDRLDRTLKELDRRTSREVQKIGVIYVAPGQTQQNEILANECGSPLFEEFVNRLGWEIDLKKHLGYCGGLDTYTDVDGATAPYYADYQTEVIFHVNTRIPNSKNNPKQIKIKKHIGNDIVQIIWSENDQQEYDPMTITSKFNFAHIVIYPLPNGLFKIQVFMKPNVKFFGPLLKGMIVNKQILPFFVRSTAMMANKFVRYEQRAYQHPFPTRWYLLNETIERYKTNFDTKDYFSSIFLSKNSQFEKI